MIAALMKDDSKIHCNDDNTSFAPVEPPMKIERSRQSGEVRLVNDVPVEFPAERAH